MADKKRILLVDDEQAIVLVAKKRLEIAGYEVTVALDGQTGLEQARATTPDLLVLDLMLPKLNGYEVCTMLKQDTRYRHIPIVLFTAKTQEKDEELGRACGADAYVRKPYKPEVLLGQVQALLVPPPDPAATGGSARRAGPNGPASGGGIVNTPQVSETGRNAEGGGANG